MRALVTGASGFVGQWLCRALVRDGSTVLGTTLDVAPPVGILSKEELTAVTWRSIDLRPGAEDRRSVRALVEKHRPEVIFHLAGVSYVPSAADDPAGALATNVGALVRLLKALRGPRDTGVADPVVLVVGSGEQYGQHDADALPLVESVECRPHGLYAATKVAQEVVALAAHRAEGARVIATRSFNHGGPGQAKHFLLPALAARAIAARTSGVAIPIGNVDVVRDFLHVEDVVAAYIALAVRGVPGEVYNVSSGEGVRIGDIASELLAQAGVSVGFRVDPALQRAVDVPALVGSNAKLRAATGWTPRRTRSDIISDLLASLDAAS